METLNIGNSLAVLSVEDDPVWLNKIKSAAKVAGWRFLHATSIEEARSILIVETVDIILLDRMLGRLEEGLILVDWLKEIETPLPGIIVLSYLNEIGEQILGLERGVDDYIEKPFDEEALIARVRALARRLTGVKMPSSIEMYGDLELHTKAEQAYWRGERIKLQKKCFALLRAIAAGGGESVATESLWQEVWNDYRSLPPQVSVMNTAISRIRNSLRKHEHAPRILKEGPGYKLAQE
ncbi:MAG: response regulator transcription factor [Methylomonas sp.]|jgi:DNA-binding response OmpR family regulator|uniref:response regulator transcription factor n=1 Tax=Methylomonas sp. TaxID=418 RepID=UPI0025F5835D|nr:response regulator transcription factor [Methylomonas sp.]MCK9608662.1 response regulator transcription factor [Methylomonas sp.]